MVLIDGVSGDNLSRNLIICFLWTFLVNASNIPLHELQSSVHIKNGVGTISLTVGTAASTIVVLFSHSFLANRYGVKCMMVVGSLCVATFSLCNFYPEFSVMIPGIIIADSGCALAFASHFALATVLSETYAQIKNASSEKAYILIFGSQIVAGSLGLTAGQLLCYFVAADFSHHLDYNSTERVLCGPVFVDSKHDTNSNFDLLTPFYTYVLFGCFAVISLLASLIVAFGLVVPSAEVRSLSTKELVLETLKLCPDRLAFLLNVADVHRGIFLALLTTDFTKAYTVCLGGIQLLGLAATVFGCSFAIFSFLFMWLAKVWCRQVVFVISFVFEVVFVTFHLFWSPSVFPNDRAFVLSMFIFGGASVGGQNLFFPILRGYLFPERKEASMALSGFACGLGSVFAIAISSFLPMAVKIYILYAFLFATVVSYIILEMLVTKREPKSLVNVVTSIGTTHVYYNSM